MTPPPRTIRARWILAGLLVWLILAASITLELGQPNTARWASVTALGVTGLILLALALRTTTRTARSAVRLVRRRAHTRR